MAKEMLAVDIGGVIINHTKVGDVYPPLPDVFEILKKLREERFGENLHLVSHADPYLRHDMLSWLGDQNFYQLTGISFSHINFCEQRSGKAVICKGLGVTHVIDDRREVMAYLRAVGISQLYLFQEREEEQGKFLEVMPYVKRVASWREVAQELLR